MAASQVSKSSLPKRRLGRTDMTITPVGFGAWAIGGPDWAVGWGAQDDKKSIAAIRHAVERGVNWIDTAAIYGLGHSEEIVRAALKEIPAANRPLVFTKCGLIWDENDRKAFPRQVGAPDSIRREVERSLRRLGLERIDLYQMHWPAKDGTRDRGLLARAPRPQERRQGARRGPLQSQRRPARGGRAHRPRRHAAAAVLGHQARVRRQSSCPGAARTRPASSSTARCRPGS